MIPLAVWAGMPSTACVCANGHVKLFCQQGSAAQHAASHHTACSSNCCGHDEAEADSDLDTDCCGGGFCCHGANAGKAGISSKAYCKPVLTAPSVAPETVSVPLNQSPAIAAVVEQVGALVRPSFTADVAEFNTGPPLDRVIVFRSLLI